MTAPEKASHDGAIRDGALFCYKMFAYIDGAFMQQAVAALQQPDGKAKLKEAAKAGTILDQHAEVLEAMNAKLNALIQREVGEDVGQMLPGGVEGGWVVSDAVYDV